MGHGRGRVIGRFLLVLVARGAGMDGPIGGRAASPWIRSFPAVWTGIGQHDAGSRRMPGFGVQDRSAAPVVRERPRPEGRTPGQSATTAAYRSPPPYLWTCVRVVDVRRGCGRSPGARPQPQGAPAMRRVPRTGVARRRLPPPHRQCPLSPVGTAEGRAHGGPAPHAAACDRRGLSLAMAPGYPLSRGPGAGRRLPSGGSAGAPRPGGRSTAAPRPRRGRGCPPRSRRRSRSRC